MFSIALLYVFAFFAFIVPALAQNAGDEMQNMPGMGTASENPPQAMKRPPSSIEATEMHAGSGTDAEPDSTPYEMWMATRGKWTFMLHGVAFLNDMQQSGPRGADRFFSTNWLMATAQRK